MSKTSIITTRLDEETLAQVDRLAAGQGRSRSWFAAQAIREVVAREAEIEAAVQRGFADLEAGRRVSHDVAIGKIEAMIAGHKAR